MGLARQANTKVGESVQATGNASPNGRASQSPHWLVLQSVVFFCPMSRISAQLFPQSPLAILVANAESLILTEVNPAAELLFSRDAQALRGQSLESLFLKQHYQHFLEVLQSGPGPHLLLQELLRGPEQSFYAEIRASLLGNATGSEWMIFARDISSEREARDALARSEREYRRMVENSPDGMALVQEGLVVFANMACERLLGVASPDQLWTAEFAAFIHPDDLALWKRREEALFSGHALGRCEIRLLAQGGRVVRAELAQHLIERADATAMQVTLRDVTARYAITNRLKESEALYKGLASVAFDGVCVHKHGILLQTNHSFDAIFGYTDEGTAGESIYNLIAEEQREYLRQEMENGKVLELEGLHKEGHRIQIEAHTMSCMFLGEMAHVTALREIGERKNAEQAMRHQAYFDGLTGLPNRQLFFDRLSVAIEQASRENRLLAVLFLDLDRFKNVNDSLGHNVGDLLLFDAADRLSDCLRKSDTVSRLGGDEFTILLSEINAPGDAGLVAEKIIQAINQPFLLQEQSINIGVSIGIALFPEHGKNADDLIKAADTAMYLAKDNGRNNFQIYSRRSDNGNDKLGLESQLRQAIENEEFVVYYQPKIELATGRLHGAEALVRWKHPTRGLVFPDDFIPLAEETRLIVPLGEWVLLESCRQAKRWEKDNVKISVNLSPWQLHKADLVQRVDKALAGTRVKPDLIELEITETTAMKNPGLTLTVLRELVKRGLSISLDDFGKGYSSLNYLKQFPVNTIKIDMSFIRDVLTEPKDSAIVRAIILLAQNLNMRVLAEGVETAAQAEFLRHEGCDLAQGYHYSRPVTAEAFEALMKSPGWGGPGA
jgi:diguanylate cyclase (GGDEF)-like protein/PAS domain S-box-containing protein